MNWAHWQYKILKALELEGIGKHSRQRRPKRFWQKARKQRNLMARESRKINRRQTNKRRNKPSRRHT